MIAIIFSKDRALQLSALLQSLRFAAGYQTYIDEVFVIWKGDENSYKEVLYDEAWITPIDQDKYGGFEASLRNVIDVETNQHTTILFLCDDGIFTGFINLDAIRLYLWNTGDVLEFSLRLGTNISPQPLFIDKSPFLEWDWRSAPSHYGYNFSVTADIHRQPLIVEILDHFKDKIETPNHLEHYGVQYTRETQKKIINACMKQKGSVVTLPLNRVQDAFPNWTNGTATESVEALRIAYNKGKRLNWAKLWNLTPSDPFISNKYFELI
jgi:hypothetical protein